MTDAVKNYLEKIKDIPLLTPEEEKKLARLIKKGDKEAKEKMIRANLKLVVNIAKNYVNMGVPFMDLIAEGNLGLIKAVEKFNPRKGYKFSTYASWWIKQAISRALFSQARTVKIPIYLMEISSRIRKAREELSAKLGREPTLKELAKKLKMSVKKIEYIDLLISKTTSLSAPLGGKGKGEVIDVVKNPQDITGKEINRFIERQKLDELMEELSDREREVLDLRFGLKDGKIYTLGQVSKKMKISRERVRQIEIKALEKMKEYLKGRSR